MSDNANLSAAKRAADDEFYTRYDDVAAEMRHYDPAQFAGKVVYCPCDSDESQIYRWLKHNFARLRLKHLIATAWSPEHTDLFGGACGEVQEYDGDSEGWGVLEGNGDFANKESTDIMDEADIIVTNPPFSKFRLFFQVLQRHGYIGGDKRFLIVGNSAMCGYFGTFPLIKNRLLWMGGSPRGMELLRPDGTTAHVNACWWTNLRLREEKPFLALTGVYKGNEHLYPRYDNYAAIEVNQTRRLPGDYWGVMGVPLTFLPLWNPRQFELIGASENVGQGLSAGIGQEGSHCPRIDGRNLFSRFFIRRIL